jgi:hypothetical protein
MTHICKQEWMGCAIATAASIADLSYKEVVDLCDGVRAAELREYEAMRQLLEKVTCTRWVGKHMRRPKPVLETLFPDYPVAAWLENRRIAPNFGQWIAIRRELIHDPGLQAAYHFRRYLRRNWIVAALLEPADPLNLESRRHAHSRHVLEELAEQMSLALADRGDHYGPAS